MAVLSEKYPIDIVVTWVDDGDSRWLKKGIIWLLRRELLLITSDIVITD